VLISAQQHCKIEKKEENKNKHLHYQQSLLLALSEVYSGTHKNHHSPATRSAKLSLVTSFLFQAVLKL
jgi:hypothetical protein